VLSEVLNHADSSETDWPSLLRALFWPCIKETGGLDGSGFSCMEDLSQEQ
jgi:hypothetical protein